jgi:hypothetical protein
MINRGALTVEFDQPIRDKKQIDNMNKITALYPERNLFSCSQDCGSKVVVQSSIPDFIIYYVIMNWSFASQPTILLYKSEYTILRSIISIVSPKLRCEQDQNRNEAV